MLLATALGVAPPRTDGLSLVPPLLGQPSQQQQQQQHPYLYWENGSQSRHAQSVRLDRWWAYRAHPSQALELYDLSRDVMCRRNLAEAHPEVVKRVLTIFQEAHEPSTWYTNPGESQKDVKAKQNKAQSAGTSQTPTRANTLYAPKP